MRHLSFKSTHHKVSYAEFQKIIFLDEIEEKVLDKYFIIVWNFSVPYNPNTFRKNATVLAMTFERWRVMVWFSPSMICRVALVPYVGR